MLDPTMLELLNAGLTTTTDGNMIESEGVRERERESEGVRERGKRLRLKPF